MSADADQNLAANAAKKKPAIKRGGLQAVDLLQQVHAVREELPAAKPDVSQRNSDRLRGAASQRNADAPRDVVSQRNSSAPQGAVSQQNADAPQDAVSQQNADAPQKSASQRPSNSGPQGKTSLDGSSAGAEPPMRLRTLDRADPPHAAAEPASARTDGSEPDRREGRRVSQRNSRPGSLTVSLQNPASGQLAQTHSPDSDPADNPAESAGDKLQPGTRPHHLPEGGYSVSRNAKGTKASSKPGCNAAVADAGPSPASDAAALQAAAQQAGSEARELRPVSQRNPKGAGGGVPQGNARSDDAAVSQRNSSSDDADTSQRGVSSDGVVPGPSFFADPMAVSQRNSVETGGGVPASEGAPPGPAREAVQALGRNLSVDDPGIPQQSSRRGESGASQRSLGPGKPAARRGEKTGEQTVSQRNSEVDALESPRGDTGAVHSSVSQRNTGRAHSGVSQRNTERDGLGISQRNTDRDDPGISQRNLQRDFAATPRRSVPNGIRAYFTPITSGRRAGLVSLSAIKTRQEGQVRRLNPLEDADFDDLVASIRIHGVIQPVSLTWDDSQDCFWTDYGHRRVAAARAAGLKMVPAIVATQGEGGDAPDALGAVLTQKQLIENLQRTQLPPVDIAHAINRLASEGLSAAAIAQALGKSKSWVSKHQKILELPASVLDRSDAADLGYELLYTIATATSDPTERDALIEVAKAGGRPAVQHTLDVQRAMASGNARSPAETITEALLPGIEPDKLIRAREATKGRPKLPMQTTMQRAEKAVYQLQTLAEALADPVLDEIRLRAKALLGAIAEYQSGPGTAN